MYVYQSTPMKSAVGPEKLKILLAIRNQRNQQRALIFLSLCGFRDIVVADTGKDALKLFSEGVDLVILGHYLLDMSGIELCRAIRRKNPYRNIPVITSFSPEQELRQQYQSAGITHFLTIGDDINELLKKIRIC